VDLYYVSATAKPDELLRERIYLSKEEVGEILVRETERRRFRSSVEIPQLSQLKPTVPLTTANADYTCVKYKETSCQQSKTCPARDDNRWESGDIPNAADKKPPEIKALNCQPVTSRHGQRDDQSTRSPDSVSSNGDLPRGGGTCSRFTLNMIGNCTAKSQQNENTQHSSEGGHDISVNSASCAVPGNNDRLQLDVAEALRPAGTSKKKKTVTFSDNVELVASAGDVTGPVDYMLYAASIGRQAGSPADSLPSTKNTVEPANSCCTDSDVLSTMDSSDETDENCATSSGSQVRCSLCRQTWVELTDTYCSNCSFYLSKLQMTS